MAYAYKKDGKWIEITGPFTMTREVKRWLPEGKATVDGAQPLREEVYKDEVQYPENWVNSATPAELQSHVIKPVMGPAPIPPGNRAIGMEVVDIGGTPNFVYILEPFTHQEKVDIKIQEIEDAYNERLKAGMITQAFGNAERLQLIDLQPYIRIGFKGAKADDQEAENPLPFRTVSNNNYNLSNKKSVELVEQINDYANALLEVKWSKKEKARGAGTQAVLENIDVNADWP